jgi:hypothetical protein
MTEAAERPWNGDYYKALQFRYDYRESVGYLKNSCQPNIPIIELALWSEIK